MVLMRIKRGICHGELGGPAEWKFPVAFAMISSWVLYIILCFINSLNDNALEDAIFIVSPILIGLSGILLVAFEILAQKGLIKPYPEPEQQDELSNDLEQPADLPKKDGAEVLPSAAPKKDDDSSALLQPKLQMAPIGNPQEDSTPVKDDASSSPPAPTALGKAVDATEVSETPADKKYQTKKAVTKKVVKKKRPSGAPGAPSPENDVADEYEEALEQIPPDSPLAAETPSANDALDASAITIEGENLMQEQEEKASADQKLSAAISKMNADINDGYKSESLSAPLQELLDRKKQELQSIQGKISSEPTRIEELQAEFDKCQLGFKTEMETILGPR
jgi:hypothetical protein